METTTPNTGYSGAVSGTTTIGGTGQFDANRAADNAHGTVDNVTQSAHEAVDRVASKAVRALVPDYQLSLAIGKEGQNARLAAKLTGAKIDIQPDSILEDA